MVMKKIINWFNKNRNGLVRNSFLLPILLVVIMSISHVVSWYDLGNPMSWAIYLSIAIEVFALASVSAASIKVNRGSIWFLFGLVTAIQIIGNIFFEYRDISLVDESFLSWVELIEPVFDDWDLTDHRRLLASIQGGTLPLMSLTALHFYIKFNDKLEENEETPNSPEDDLLKSQDENEDTSEHVNKEKQDRVFEKVKELYKEGKLQKDDSNEEEPTAFANSEYREKEDDISLQNALDNTEQWEMFDAIDEDEFLKEFHKQGEENEENEESISLSTESNDKVEQQLNDLSSKEEEEAKEEDDTFGPPQINNPQ